MIAAGLSRMYRLNKQAEGASARGVTMKNL